MVPRRAGENGKVCQAPKLPQNYKMQTGTLEKLDKTQVLSFEAAPGKQHSDFRLVMSKNAEVATNDDEK